MPGDLLRAVARREVLGAVQRRPALLGRQAQELGGDQRDSASRAFLPRRVRGGVDDDLADDAPAGVMGLAAGDQEAGERLGQNVGVGFCAEVVQVPQRFADVTASFHGARELVGAASRPEPDVGRRQGASRFEQALTTAV